MTTTLSRGLCAAIFVALPLSPTMADELSAADYQRYFGSPAVLAAAAATAARVAHCSAPLIVDQQGPDDDHLIRLSFTCNANDEQEATSTIEFREYEGGLLVPERFLFAG